MSAPDQLTLGVYPEAPRTRPWLSARISDPVESVQAAAQLTVARDRAIWAHLKLTGQTLTADELAAQMRKHPGTVSSALSRLLRDGFVDKFPGGVSACGRACGRYRAVSE